MTRWLHDEASSSNTFVESFEAEGKTVVPLDWLVVTRRLSTVSAPPNSIGNDAKG